jgi:hypothetical protein
MLFNAERNFLFIHIQKTAGTSITRYLCEKPGWTFIQPPHLLRRQVFFPDDLRPFTFSVVRNPWERLVSWWRMLLRKGVHNDFSRYMLAQEETGRELSLSDFIRRTGLLHETEAELHFTAVGGLSHVEPRSYLKSIAYNQIDYLMDNAGKLVVDRCLRFDRLETEWPNLMKILHPECAPESLPRINAAPDNDPHWRSHYADAADIEWVARLYERDIRHFGFSFDGR